MSEKSLILRSGDTYAEVWPERGGAIGRFASGTPAGEWHWFDADAHQGVGCFPLIPFASRIRDGAFAFGAQRVNLPPNNPPEPHAIHGHGWQTRWQVVEVAPDRATLRYRHEADAWPWSYEAEQSFFVAGNGLEIELRVRNLAAQPMPCGLGLHPYFAAAPEAQVRADVQSLWRLDEDLMSVERIAVPATLDLANGQRLTHAALDHVFSGWSGLADIAWPAHDLGVQLDADPLFGNLVIYAPADAPFFCVEPVSNVPDAFNLMARNVAGHGAVELAPGRSVRGSVRFRPRW